MPTKLEDKNKLTSVNMINEEPPNPEDAGFIKLEDDSGFLLLEDGGKLVLEAEPE